MKISTSNTANNIFNNGIMARINKSDLFLIPLEYFTRKNETIDPDTMYVRRGLKARQSPKKIITNVMR